MTNHWSDIANATLVIAWGANPTENHPACIAHVNRARFPKQYFPSTDLRSQKKEAKLIVVDPRKTRTALQVDPARGDKYIRIRPGTDIALFNGVVHYIIDQMESSTSAVPAATKTNFTNFLNQTSAGTFFTDGSSGTASTSVATVGGCSKYTDARFIVDASGLDYVRARVDASGVVTVAGPNNTTISDFPQKAATITGDPNTVYNVLKAHVSPYTASTVAGICGCAESDVSFLGDAIIANSRCSGYASGAPTTILTDPRDPNYRATTLLYAMGITQHTYGSQNVKSFAVLQTLMGNMGRAGGGINALRGIHNVQGSTDMGLLYGNIPAYSGNPTLQYPADPNAFGKYMNALWGNPLSGAPTLDASGVWQPRKLMNGSYDDAYNPTAMALQQRGFFNMTLKWFGGYADASGSALTPTARKPIVNAAYSLWPKGNGDDHITMFRKMGTGAIKAAVIWGQNPAVTEPNQGKIRDGLYQLDTLVCVDMFATETAQVSRKPLGVTYLIPTAAHVEKAGSATNSGRTLQWRYEATLPSGNAKEDTELLLRLAKALDSTTPNSAFKHIHDVWTSAGITHGATVFDTLYGTPYGGFSGTTGYNALSGTAEKVTVRKNVEDAVVYTTAAVTGSEWVNETIYREMCLPSANGGTIWIYTGAYNNTATWTTDNKGSLQAVWAVQNRAKSRDRTDDGNILAYHGWGYSWLVNRRVLYNNAEVIGDVSDFFMGPDSCSRLFVSTNTAVLNYSRWYRTIHLLKDKPSPVLAGNTSSPHYVGGKTFAGRFPAHTEPYETPRANDLALDSSWGRNSSGTAWNLVKTDTPIAGRGQVGDPPISQYPLVLTTIRCVEHFQGGPITRNNWWNVEIEPEPWIEINGSDAAKYSIKDGDMVRVVSARTESLTDQQMPLYGSGFRARVGNGLAANQKVAPGVVAIPWHWGDQGLSTGSRANDITVDAVDANSAIPEYKACLCRIEKM